MNFTKLFAAVAGCALAFSSAGCNDTTGTVVVPGDTGTLTLKWTVAGSADPGSCAFYGASDLELVVYDAAGAPFTSTTAPCEDFGLTIDLPPGTFSADATLLDPNAVPVSVAAPLDNIRIISGTDITIDLDFPAASML